MRIKNVLLLSTVLAVSILLVVSVATREATAVSQRVRPDLPSDVFVARVYYNNLKEINDLATYDVWEYNNLDEKYVLVALEATDYDRLEHNGWILQVDQRASSQLGLGVTPPDGPPFASGYHTVDEYYSTLDQLNNQYPQLTELVDYGESACLAKGGCTTLGGEFLPGHDLLAFRISNEAVAGVSETDESSVLRGTKPVFFLLANIHAREITTPEIAMRLLEHLLDNYGENADITWLVDWHEIWVVPVANPDGHWLVELGAQNPYNRGAFYQRKNANSDSDNDNLPDCFTWPPETNWQYGVDLNRNHEVAWGGAGSSDDPCSQSFRGPTPVSETETASLQALVEALIPDQRGDGLDDKAPQTANGILLTLHSYGELVLWPWEHSENRAPNYDGLEAIGEKLSSLNGYRSCQASTCLYSASGTTADWAYGDLGIPAFTFEIGTQFMPAYSEIDNSQWPQNLPSLLYAARIARTPYEIIFGPDVDSIESNISTTGDRIEINATIDNSDHGVGPVTAASYAIDLPFWAPGVSPERMSAVDGTFDSSIETVTAIVSLDGIDPGRHILYVNGENSAGHWGPTAASFFVVGSGKMTRTFIPFHIFSH